MQWIEVLLGNFLISLAEFKGQSDNIKVTQLTYKLFN